MPVIPRGDFGFQGIQAGQSPAAPPGAFVSGNGLMRVGQAIEKVADTLYEREAIAYSTKAIIDAKNRLDQFERDFSANPLGEDGQPRYGTVVGDFEAQSQEVLARALEGTNNRLAKDTVSRDLQAYSRSVRDRVADRALRQRNDHLKAGMMATVEETMTGALPTQEKLQRLDLLYAGAVRSGFMNADDAQRELQTRTQKLHFGDKYQRIASTNTITGAYALRQELSEPDQRLSTEQNIQLLRLADDRISFLDKQTERDVRGRQDAITKMLIRDASEGALTKEKVLLFERDLTPEQFDKFMQLPDIAARRQVDGADNPELYRSMQKEILKSYRDARSLTRLRDRISDYMTGYDPTTRKFGTPGLSRNTGRQLINDIEEYLGRIQSDAQRSTNEAEQRTDREFRDVERLLKGAIDTYKNSRIGRGAQAEAEAFGQKAMEDLLKNRGSATKWWEDWKKKNADVLNVKPQLPSWVPQPNGRPDFDAARKQLLDEKKRGMPDATYQQRFNRIQELERAYAPK